MVVVLKRFKSYYFINGVLSDSVIEALDRELSYYVQGAEYTDKFKRGEWDGYEHLLRQSKTGSYYFPVGLLNRVCSLLEYYNVDYTIVEPQVQIKKLYLTWNAPKLRSYQEEAVTNALSARSGVICLPTGSGKTLIGLKIIHSLDTTSLIVVHTKELLYQWYNQIKRILSYNPGIVGDSNREFRDITVGMVQTLYRSEINRDFAVLLFDEVHHIPAETFFDVAMRVNAIYRYGLSATPRREDGADLKIFAGVGEICVNITAEQLIDYGYLAKPKFYFLDVPPIKLPGDWHRAYNEGIVANRKRNELILRVAEILASEDFRVYIHVARIDHGEIIANMLGVPFICGGDSSKRRINVIEDFRSGREKILVSTLLGEGVDIPEMDAIILAQGQKTSIGTIQKIGRALRVSPTKQYAIVVDFMDKGRFLSDHYEQRYKIMKEYYGKYFKPVIVSGDVNDVNSIAERFRALL